MTDSMILDFGIQILDLESIKSIPNPKSKIQIPDFCRLDRQKRFLRVARSIICKSLNSILHFGILIKM
jgi:hypothetical protein